jgi:hypothetical protein
MFFRDGNSMEEKQELIRLDETGMTFSLNGTTMHLATRVDYNSEGQWHYVVVSWNKADGLLTFFIDTIRQPVHNYMTGQTLDL